MMSINARSDSELALDPVVGQDGQEILDVPVLIVGAGPSGATLAVLLGKYGIRSLVISRHSSTANTPRAHIFNQRAMEVMRDAGLESMVLKHAVDSKYMMHTSWLHSLSGEEYGRLWAWGNKPDRLGDYETASPCHMSDLPQSRLEPILIQHAHKFGAEVRFSTEFLSQESLSEDRIVSTLRDRQTQETYIVKSRYLIGADGARSAVLNSIGVIVDGKQLNDAFNVHIRADLEQYFVHRPGSLNWILNPEAPEWSAVGNFRMVHPWDEFVVSMHPSSKDGKPFEPTNEDIIKRLHQMIGDTSISIEILSSFRWTINDQVARTWQKGNVLCIGDAAHRHPPINGLGSNTCISDAMNLAWKLALVLQGVADPKLLETLTTERKPVGDGVVKRANTGMEAHRSLWALIGLTTEERMKRTMLMEQDTLEGYRARTEFNAALEATDAEVNALGIQMNQMYFGSAATAVEADDIPPDLSKVDLVMDQVKSTFPGIHLPHVWLAKNGHSERISSLDLCGHSKFTLLTGIGGESWREAARVIEATRPGLKITVWSIGWRQNYMDAYREWERVRGVEENGAVLVRPDCFVAWRSKQAPTDATDVLRQVFDKILPPMNR